MRQVLTTFLAIALVAGCGRDAPSATDAPQRAAISSRELEDASDAIEKFMQAGRTREAELLARTQAKLKALEARVAGLEKAAP